MRHQKRCPTSCYQQPHYSCPLDLVCNTNRPPNQETDAMLNRDTPIQCYQRMRLSIVLVFMFVYIFCNCTNNTTVKLASDSLTIQSASGQTDQLQPPQRSPTQTNRASNVKPLSELVVTESVINYPASCCRLRPAVMARAVDSNGLIATAGN